MKAEEVEKKINFKFRPTIDMVCSFLDLTDPKIVDIGPYRKYVIFSAKEEEKPIRVATVVRGSSKVLFQDIVFPLPLLYEQYDYFVYNFLSLSGERVRSPSILKGRELREWINDNYNNLRWIKTPPWVKGPVMIRLDKHRIQKNFWVFKSDRTSDIQKKRREEYKKKGMKSLKEAMEDIKK